jgi:signal transduction histidine kinase
MEAKNGRNESASEETPEPRGARTAREFRDLSHRILQKANRPISRSDFLHEVIGNLIEFSGCREVELWLGEDGSHVRSESRQVAGESFRIHMAPLRKEHRALFAGSVFWTADAEADLADARKEGEKARLRRFSSDGRFHSIAIVPLPVADKDTGFLVLKSERRGFFDQETVDLYTRFARNLGIALAGQRTQAALRERLKELTCLYAIANLAATPGISLADILRGIVELLPPAWQYPVITFAKIVLDRSVYSTPGFPEEGRSLTASIMVGGQSRGFLQVVYAAKKPELDEGPFLREERVLIDAVARQTALIVERKQVEEERTKLHEQLRHADRLATIGQLAAHVAHELNEPLGNILGLAQLAEKDSALPSDLAGDLRKIVDACLHSREVIRKLMTFARQAPVTSGTVDLNEVVEKGLYFLEARCSKGGVELERELSPNLPLIEADPAQMSQILVNLVVNALQAMPDGGRLTVRTLAEGDHIRLVVEDTGIGMSEETMEKIFIPFFTTKDVDEGTGLGLPVVQGIVAGHQGRIEVFSQVGEGSRFEVRLPAAGPEPAREDDENAGA